MEAPRPRTPALKLPVLRTNAQVILSIQLVQNDQLTAVGHALAEFAPLAMGPNLELSAAPGEAGANPVDDALGPGSARFDAPDRQAELLLPSVGPRWLPGRLTGAR